MRMSVKIVYVLVFEEEDCFYETFLLSLHSLRYREPLREVEVVLDRESYGRILGKKDPLLENVKLIMVDIPPKFTGVERSRFLKTGLRDIIEGDFLYIDSDTVICEPFDAVDTFEMDLAAVPNEHGTINKVVVSSYDDRVRRAGLGDRTKGPRFNGGVLFVKDSEVSRRFFRLWRELWLGSVANGVAFDQPALFIANRETGFPIRELPGGWNCQICTELGPHFFNTAGIIHYYGSISHFAEDVIIPHVKSTGGLDPYAGDIARDPKKYGFGIYNPSHVPKLKAVFSDLMFSLKGCPPVYHLISSSAGLLSRTISWLRSQG